MNNNKVIKLPAYLLGYEIVMPAMSCVGHLKKKAVRKAAAIILRITKYKDNLSGLGFLQDANTAPTKLDHMYHNYIISYSKKIWQGKTLLNLAN